MIEVRNIAIIAHVDHGKTTLVDKMILQAKVEGSEKSEDGQFLDNNALERERGITILSKNVSVNYKGVKINVIDTPGHADFGGEVERVLNMADGVLLLVDALEGPMPQTRFVLEKALNIGLRPIVVINKVDKPNCQPERVQEDVFDLMFSLGATEEQLGFPTIYGSAKGGWMSLDFRQPADSLAPLLDTIIDYVPAPQVEEGSVQLLITSIDHSNYLGRIAVGKLHRGTLRKDDRVTIVHRDGLQEPFYVKDLMVFIGLAKKSVDTVEAGDICAVVGMERFDIGDSICDVNSPEPLPTIAVDEPTMSMLFTINNSPFFGRDGKFVTSRHLKERLDRELEKNLALRVKPGASPDAFIVFGRGILHLSILIETMRREGYELQVGQPQVVIKTIDGQQCEPIEFLSVGIPEEYSGKAIELTTRRKGVMLKMESKVDGRVDLEFEIPSRGIIGLRNQLLTASAGEAVVTHRLKGFEPYRGAIETRQTGSLVSIESGTAYAYALNKLQDRGAFFIEPQEEVYVGQVVGEGTRDKDIPLNVCKAKKLTNMRASGSDDKINLAPAIKFSLEEALEYIREDEYVEVTPHALRIRKIILDPSERKRAERDE